MEYPYQRMVILFIAADEYHQKNKTIFIGFSGRIGHDFVMDNCWMVLYNPYLTKRHKFHINVEVHSSIQAIKYVNKYVCKGSDRATLKLKIPKTRYKKNLHPRHIGFSKAIWTLFEFNTHEENRNVISLQMHLSGQQAVYFPNEA